MGGFLKSKGKGVKAFKSPGITDAGVMDSSDLFNVNKNTMGLSTAGRGSILSGRGSAVEDIGTAEGRKITKRSRKKATGMRK